ncbi:hypothetical protein [Kutzneria buriramensis]|uniref:Uncharacterized protein n=1 Tax=Kutzneria buriramensis TaxID=1045776 RepID=A0A3E0HD87_9PSEU|nr:hypothetical protein [Kutzneria buriramensis]REH42709.1 hypothetical protein BCF44_110206 [Kutzneria buriramensis]
MPSGQVPQWLVIVLPLIGTLVGGLGGALGGAFLTARAARKREREQRQHDIWKQSEAHAIAIKSEWRAERLQTYSKFLSLLDQFRKYVPNEKFGVVVKKSDTTEMHELNLAAWEIYWHIALIEDGGESVTRIGKGLLELQIAFMVAAHGVEVSPKPKEGSGQYGKLLVQLRTAMRNELGVSYHASSALTTTPSPPFGMTS